MTHTLVISGHPNLKNSICNRIILEEYEKNIPNVVIHKIDEYNYNIDVKKEHAALSKADIIILQFPIQWYSVPSTLKKWLEDVITEGFAYGQGGDKLKGKHLLIGATFGGASEAYAREGYNYYYADEFLYPLKQTFALTGIIYHTPIREYSMGGNQAKEDLQKKSHFIAKKIINQVKMLSQ